VKLVTVDIADLQVSADPDAVLVTYALGSCIAVILYDPGRRVGGMIHYMLPLSSCSPEKAKSRPAMFADTGIPLLFHSMYALGCNKRDLVVKVVGGGAPLDDNGVFEIGPRNHTMVRKMLWKAGVAIAAEDTGGKLSRTPKLYVDTGRVTIRSQEAEREL
jgi:chemotaxis protein CheD